MAFQFSHEFHRNWLAASKTERSHIKNDLKAIVDLLKPDTDLASWQKKHGLYAKNTTAAEQVGLFDEPAPQAAEENTVDALSILSEPADEDDKPTIQPTHHTTTQPTTQLTSHFLQKVTQGTAANASASTLQPDQVNTDQSANPDWLDQFEHDLDAHIQQLASQMKRDVMGWVTEKLKQH